MHEVISTLNPHIFKLFFYYKVRTYRMNQNLCEKCGRGGKSVSVLFGLPQNEKYWLGLTKKLKAHCGSGRTYKEGTIEIQGDHRDQLRSYLEKMGFSVKLAGG